MNSLSQCLFPAGNKNCSRRVLSYPKTSLNESPSDAHKDSVDLDPLKKTKVSCLGFATILTLNRAYVPSHFSTEHA